MLYYIESFCPLRKIVFKHKNILFALEINLIFSPNRVVFSIYDAYICVLFILVYSARTCLTIQCDKLIVEAKRCYTCAMFKRSEVTFRSNICLLINCGQLYQKRLAVDNYNYKLNGIGWPFQPLLGLYWFFVVHILQTCIPGAGCVKGV